MPPALGALQSCDFSLPIWSVTPTGSSAGQRRGGRLCRRMAVSGVRQVAAWVDAVGTTAVPVIRPAGPVESCASVA